MTTTDSGGAREFDVIVIGTGSGVSIADSAAAEGLTAAIVENGPFGGTCVNRGCIPSKQLIHSADVMEVIDKAADFGIIAHVDYIDWEKIVSRVISQRRTTPRRPSNPAIAAMTRSPFSRARGALSATRRWKSTVSTSPRRRS